MVDVLSILKSEAAQSIFQRYDLEAIYLFGSYAHGRADSGSDVDIAVLFPPGGSPTQRFQRATTLQWELKPLLNLPLDIVPLNDANPLLAFEGVMRGKMVYARDADDLFRYEMRVRHCSEDDCHILDFYTQALREELGVA